MLRLAGILWGTVPLGERFLAHITAFVFTLPFGIVERRVNRGPALTIGAYCDTLFIVEAFRA